MPTKPVRAPGRITLDCNLQFHSTKCKLPDYGIWCHHFTSGQTVGEKMKTFTNFIFLGSKITVDSDCIYEIKRPLLLGRKAMTNLDRILKSRDITLLTKVLIVKSMVIPVVMYGCES